MDFRKKKEKSNYLAYVVRGQIRQDYARYMVEYPKWMRALSCRCPLSYYGYDLPQARPPVTRSAFPVKYFRRSEARHFCVLTFSFSTTRELVDVSFTFYLPPFSMFSCL